MKTTHKTIDIIALGQSFVDLCGEQIGSSLKDMLSFKKTIGGAPISIAIGCARLGLHTALVSAVGEDDLGKSILETLQQENIDTSQIQIDKHHQSALMLRAIENRNSFPFILHQENCATLNPDADIDSSFIAKSDALLVVSSNFFNKNISIASRKAMTIANENQTKVILALDFYLNSNANIISSTLNSALPLCDIIIGNERDFRILGTSQDTQDALHHLRTLTNAIFVIDTNAGCYVVPHQISNPWQNTLCHKGFKTNAQIPYPAKEAFTAGFLYGWLKNHSQEKCCEFAKACAALIQARQEDSSSLPSIDELNLYLSDQNQIIAQTSQTPLFDHIHYASTRKSLHKEFYTFNFGYHQQWQKMAQSFELNDAYIEKAKALVAHGLKNAAINIPNMCIMTDIYPQQEIMDLLPSGIFVVRAIEAPNEVPLRFQGNPDITHTLLNWPKSHAVKATVIYHPDDKYALRGQQEATLSTLYRAARASSHEFIVELSPPTNSLITASTLSHIMQRFYEIGIYPDWWQISSPRDNRSWDSIQRVISEYDKYCRGVILLGHSATIEQLPILFNAAKHECCNGFAVSKSIFQSQLELWFAQKMADDAFIDVVQHRFEQVVTLWEQAKSSNASQMAKASSL
ncbi:MAG: DUF2090 domain-containing protein [Gammaproteobacteria bacterium]|jgi:5-dehydro-2-deoxygluconokinase|nr:DUF2090 domain-containing protein [Gammaproteobacteria bacterium]